MCGYGNFAAYKAKLQSLQDQVPYCKTIKAPITLNRISVVPIRTATQLRTEQEADSSWLLDSRLETSFSRGRRLGQGETGFQ